MDTGIELDDYIPSCDDISPVPNYCLRPESDLLGGHQNISEVQIVLRLDAYSEDGLARFHLRECEKDVVVHQVNSTLGEKPGPPRGGSPLYIPVHGLCLKIADRFIDAKKHISRPSSGQIRSIEDLWEVLYRRVPGNWHSHTCINPEPHYYFGGRKCRGKDWTADEDPSYGQVRISIIT